MGAAASCEAQTDAEKVAAYDKLMAKLPELVAAKAVDEAKARQILDGVAVAAAAPAKRPSISGAPAKRMSAQRRPSASGMPPMQPAEPGSLEEVFQNFCAIYREVAMTNTIFAKFCNDSKLVDKKFPKPQIDMVWSKAAGKEKKVGFATFKLLLEGIASAKGTPIDELHAYLQANAVVKNSGTKGSSRFYDDKKTWTGVATQGGPSTIEAKTSLSQLADRDNKADVRGVIAN